jgi:hypothetical protein
MVEQPLLLVQPLCISAPAQQLRNILNFLKGAFIRYKRIKDLLYTTPLIKTYMERDTLG